MDEWHYQQLREIGLEYEVDDGRERVEESTARRRQRRRHARAQHAVEERTRLLCEAPVHREVAEP